MGTVWRFRGGGCKATKLGGGSWEGFRGVIKIFSKAKSWAKDNFLAIFSAIKKIAPQAQFFCPFLVKKYLKMEVFGIKCAEGAEIFLRF